MLKLSDSLGLQNFKRHHSNKNKNNCDHIRCLKLKKHVPEVITYFKNALKYYKQSSVYVSLRVFEIDIFLRLRKISKRGS
jgi:hypothetical protein